MADQRSPEAKTYRRWYNTTTWKWARALQLATHPLCERCQAEGRTTAATVVNHRKPHKGDWSLFTNPDNHESTCKWHHDSVIQSEERTGKVKPATGIDGWPIGTT